MDNVTALIGAPVEDWFASCFVEQRAGMVRLAFVLVDDLDVAEDVVQAAFARMYVRRHTVREPLKYLRSAVYNGCRNHHRSLARRRRRVVPLNLADEPVGDHVIDVVRRLPLRRRTVIVLRFYEGLRDSEIADVMNLPIGTVKSTLSRTLASLRKELS